MCNLLCDIQYMMNQEIVDNLRLELRRGSLILAVLGILRTEQYGYALRKALDERNWKKAGDCSHRSGPAPARNEMIKSWFYSAELLDYNQLLFGLYTV